MLARFNKITCIFIFILFLFFNHQSKSIQHEKFDIYLLCNKNNKSSVELAKYYAKKRGISPRRIIQLDCIDREEISRKEFDDSIRNPLLKTLSWKFSNKPIHKKRLLLINFYGMPYKIKSSPKSQSNKNDETPKQKFSDFFQNGFGLKDKRLENKFLDDNNKVIKVFKKKLDDGASIDSELSLLKLYFLGAKKLRKIKEKKLMSDHKLFSQKKKFLQVVNYNEKKMLSTDLSYSNMVLNPYFFLDLKVNELLNLIVLTGRIDAADYKTSKRLIDDAIEVERDGLIGYSYIDLANFYPSGEKFLKNAAIISNIKGFPTIVDMYDDVYPNNYPGNNIAIYFGWYKWHIQGVFENSDFNFQKGAIASHIHSFNAASLKNTKKYWLPGLLEKGAACSLGTVYEPFLAGTYRSDIFLKNIFEGKTLVESAFASKLFLSWMNVVIGDPLYRPFKFGFQKIPKEKNLSSLTSYLKIHDQEQRHLFNKNKYTSKINIYDLHKQIKLKASKKWDGIFAESIGLKYLLYKDYDSALKLFNEAEQLYKTKKSKLPNHFEKKKDQFRIFLHKLSVHYMRKDFKKGIQMLDSYLKNNKDNIHYKLALRYLEIFEKKNVEIIKKVKNKSTSS